MSEAVEQADEALARGEAERAIALANVAAEAGDSVALRRIAEWRLIGIPLQRDVQAAKELYARARALGDVPAAMAEIALTANGCWAEPDWPRALQLLREVARRDEQAAEHLRLVDAMAIDAEGIPSTMAKADLAGERPNVWIRRGFLSPDECALIAKAGLDLLEPSVVADPATGRNMRHPIRTSSAATIGPTRESLPIRAIKQRIATAAQIDVAQCEPLILLHYAPGEEYRRHLDALPAAENQRIKTAILVLNQGFQGGGTHFHASGLTVRGRAGDAIFFDNVDESGQPDPLSAHAGLPVTAGAKWVATCWMRQSPLDLWRL